MTIQTNARHNRVGERSPLYHGKGVLPIVIKFKLCKLVEFWEF